MNRIAYRSALVLVCSVWLAACAASQSSPPAAGAAPSPELAATLTTLMTESADAWNQGDLEGFLATYAGSAVFVGASGPIRGLDQIRERYRQAYFAGGRPEQTLSFDQIEVQPLGAYHALMTGRFILSGGGSPEQSGWFTLVWSRTPDGWLIIQDHTS